MRFVRLLLYALAALVGLYMLAVVLYAIPMVGGLIDDTMEVKFDRPDSSIVADYGNGPQRPTDHRADILATNGPLHGDILARLTSHI